MSFLSNLHKGNKHWFSEQWRTIKDNPEQLFLGAMTPVGSKLWSGITGKDYKPVLDAWGGPSAQVYKSGEAKGIDMGDTHNSHRIARVVAAMAMAGGGGASGGEGPAGVQTGSANPASFGPGDATGFGGGGMNFGNMQLPGMGGGQQQPQPNPNEELLRRRQQLAAILAQQQMQAQMQPQNERNPQWMYPS